MIYHVQVISAYVFCICCLEQSCVHWCLFKFRPVYGGDDWFVGFTLNWCEPFKHEAACQDYRESTRTWHWSESCEITPTDSDRRELKISLYTEADFMWACCFRHWWQMIAARWHHTGVKQHSSKGLRLDGDGPAEFTTASHSEEVWGTDGVTHLVFKFYFFMSFLMTTIQNL